MIYAFAESKSLRDEKLTADDVSYRARHKVFAREKVSCWAEYGFVRWDVATVRLGRFRGFAIGTLLALHHFYAYHVNFLVVLHLLPWQCDTGQKTVVTVYKPYISSLGGFQSTVSGITQSAVWLIDDGHPSGRACPKRLYDRKRAVGGTIIDDNNLHLVTLLCHGDDALETLFDVAFYIICWDYYGEHWLMGDGLMVVGCWLSVVGSWLYS